jgi:aryl-alcohol dehydrogenase-like predicted oxidoreductase
MGRSPAGGKPVTPDAAPFAPRRELGRTGFVATALGIGDLADRSMPLETCVATARRALDAGLNVIDTAPNYEDGYSEQVVGAAVRGRPRESVFVIDKVDHPERPVGPQLDGSLTRLGLGHADLFVFHNLSEMGAFERLCHPGGGFDQLADAVRARGVPVPRHLVAQPRRPARRAGRGGV